MIVCQNRNWKESSNIILFKWKISDCFVLLSKQVQILYSNTFISARKGG